MAQILAAIARGEEAAFTALYRDLQPKMERYATALLAGDGEAAADVIDEAFMVIWRSADKYDGSGHAEGWIRRIVRNKAVDWIRKQKEKVGISAGEQANYETQADQSDNPEEAYEKKSDGDELSSAMERLSDEHREVLWLAYYEHKSVAEISDLIDVPENTVKTRMFHARKQLKITLERRRQETGTGP
ncbi:MAG: sigma-70 family RNA polymerase sigma factor [Sphingorhabdus sp.]